MNEHHSNNLTAAIPPLQEVNYNEINLPFNNHPVVNPAPQELNEDQNQSDPDQQSTSLPRCGFTTTFPTETLKACDTDGHSKSYMELSIKERRRRVIMASKNIIAINVCPKTLEKDGMDY